MWNYSFKFVQKEKKLIAKSRRKGIKERFLETYNKNFTLLVAIRNLLFGQYIFVTTRWVFALLNFKIPLEIVVVFVPSMAELDASLAFRRENREVSHFSRCCATNLPSSLGFRSHRMKSLGRNSSSNTFHIFLPTHHCPPSPFYFSWNNLFTNADIKFVTLCNFYGEFVLVSANFLTVARPSFSNLGIDPLLLVFFSFLLSLWFLRNFNVMIYIIIFFLYFEFSNLGEEIVKWSLHRII